MTEHEYRDMVYKKAADVRTKDDLDALLKEITEYGHDYGSIVYGCMAAMKGTFNYVNRADCGGITGFQAGCIGWECVKEFLSIQGAAKLIDYDNLLYPQYAEKFDKTISEDIWKDIQEKAKKNLLGDHASPSVKAHWESIVRGQIPFGYRVTAED
jgi:hypothetical protein